MTTTPLERRGPWVVLVLTVTWAVVTRVAMAKSDFWLDEILSLAHAGKMESPLEAFTLNHDNNHPLITLWMYVLGARTDWFVYRVPALIAGAGSIPLFWRIGRRRSVREGNIAALLGASSYLLALYSSEARGYLPAIFFSLLCLDLLQQLRVEGRGWRMGVFALSGVLGCLSHLTFAFPLGGLMVLDASTDRRLDRRRVALFARLYGAPVAVLAIIAFSRRHPVIWGGPLYTKSEVYGQLSALLVGVAPDWPEALTVAALAGVATVFVCGLLTLRQEKDELWRAHVTCVVIAPAVLLVSLRPQFFYLRYVLLCVPSFLLALASLLAFAWRRPGARVLAAVILIAWCGMNGWRTIRFFQDGRGHYLEAYRDIQRASEGRQVTISGEYDNRDLATFRYYEPLLDSRPRLIYEPADQWMEHPPDWLIFEGDSRSKPRPRIPLKNGAMYLPVKTYPYSSIESGFNWYVYHRQER